MRPMKSAHGAGEFATRLAFKLVRDVVGGGGAGLRKEVTVHNVSKSESTEVHTVKPLTFSLHIRPIINQF